MNVVKKIFFLLLMSEVFMGQQSNAQLHTTWRFDFGDGPVANGYLGVSSSDKFDSAKGYGFHKGPLLISQTRKKTKDPLTADHITSLQPFYFSVRLPEGNYDVELLVGDAENISATLVRAECRRAMTDLVKTSSSEFKKIRFTVHIKDSLIRNDGNVIGKVRLKPREHNYAHWDNLLTLEFNGPSPKICALTIQPNTTATTIFLAGNSTVVDQDKEPWAAWGQMIPAFFQPEKVVVANYAESGEALNSFRSAKRLEKVLSLMKPGDYLFIEFGHNDQKQKGEGVGPWTTYSNDLKSYIKACREKGGIPVLITSMHRRNFDSTGTIQNTLGDYPSAVRKVAQEEGVALIDLNAKSKVLYEAWGVVPSLKAFVHFPANTFPGQDKALADNTHFTTYGAYHIALCIAKGIQEAHLPLNKYLKPDLPYEYITQPMHFEDWYWPLSGVKEVVRPDGN